MEPQSDPSLDAIPIVEDDQQLYDWGIEHRLDQYYADQQQQQQQQLQAQQQQQQNYYQASSNNPGSKLQPAYILPHPPSSTVENNAYLVTTIVDQKLPTTGGKTNLPTTVLPSLPLKAENNKRVFANKSTVSSPPPVFKGSGGVPGRRPILPTVDMDENELLKVRL